MPRRPVLEVADVLTILRNAEFSFKRQESSHVQWEGYVRGKRRVVTVDSNSAPFSSTNDVTKWMIEQSGLTKDEFYRLLNGPIKDLPIGKPKKEEETPESAKEKRLLKRLRRRKRKR